MLYLGNLDIRVLEGETWPFELDGRFDFIRTDTNEPQPSGASLFTGSGMDQLGSTRDLIALAAILFRRNGPVSAAWTGMLGEVLEEMAKFYTIDSSQRSPGGALTHHVNGHGKTFGLSSDTTRPR